MQHKPLLRHALLTLSLALSASAQAHHVWIELDAQSATLYFGEFGGNLREVSPGLLDRFVKPQALHQRAEGSSPVALEKTARGFVAKGLQLRAGEALLAEEPNYPISERKQGEQTVRSLYQPAARFISSAGAQLAPQLTLDLVPVAAQGGGQLTLRAFYKGKPLAKAKVELLTAAGWSQTHHSDADGQFSVKLPWQGVYVLEIAHSDPSAGERDGQKYDRASYVTSLTLVQSEGLPALPAVEPAPPNVLK